MHSPRPEEKSALVREAARLRNDNDPGRLPNYFSDASWLFAPLAACGLALTAFSVFSVDEGSLSPDCTHCQHEQALEEAQRARQAADARLAAELGVRLDVSNELVPVANDNELTTSSCQVSVRVTEPAFDDGSVGSDDAEVVLVRMSEEERLERWTATTHGSGVHRFTNLPRGVYHLMAFPSSTAHAAPTAAPVFVCSAQNDRLFFELDLQEPDASLDLTLTGQGGKPIEGAWAMVQQPPGFRDQMWGVLHVPVDANGKLQVNLPAGRYRVVTRAPHHTDNFVDVELTANSGVMRSKLQLDWRPEVSGVVRDAKGQPLAGVEVFLGPIVDPRVPLSHARTQDDGSFVLPYTPGTQPSVTAWHQGRTVTVDTQPAQQTVAGFEAVDMRLQRGRTVEGFVITPDGKDRPFAEVRFRVRRTGHTGVVVADAKGHFVLHGMPDDAVDLWPENGASGAWSGMAATLERPKVLLTFVPPTY